MYTNLENKIRNLPRLEQALTPVFEAVSNSIDAIDDRKKIVDIGRGEIIVKIIREGSVSLTFDDDTDDIENKRKWPEIKDFIIQDNGIGFTKGNFKSFNESDSEWKLSRGGKGIGRFTGFKHLTKWKLKAYTKRRGSEKFGSLILLLKKEKRLFLKKITNPQIKR